MAIQPGTTLGPYQIDAPLGAWGMGEVYRARDAKLDRDVLLTVLRSAIAKHPVASARAAQMVLLALSVWFVSATPSAQAHGEETLNTRLVGAHDLQARSAYQPLPVEQDGRHILYVGHHAGEKLNPLTNAVEVNGTSILDVTDPASPVYLHHLPATGDAQGAQMVQVCSGTDLPGADPGETYLLRSNGNQSHELWDVSDLADPRFVTTVAQMGRTADGEQNTHKNWWECETGLAYLVGTLDGWRAPRVVQVFDLSSPAQPHRVRDFSLDGVQPDAAGPVPGGSGVHEVVRVGNRLYFSYGTSQDGVFQVVDRERLLRGDASAAAPLAPSPNGLRFPQVSRLDLPSFWGAHTAFPLLGVEIRDYRPNRDQQTRDFVVLVSEADAPQCQEARHVVFFVDITDEVHPWPVSTFQVPETSGGFCDRGGRFGPHGTQWSMRPAFYKRVQVFSWFNAGMRAVDVRNPFEPTEVGFYIPATTPNTEQRCVTIDGVENCKTAIQTNNVEVDDRGLIYLVDRANTGLHIVELTGPAALVIDR